MTTPDTKMLSAEEVNALPERVRKYIHLLETDCDPAGTIRSEVLLREHTVLALTARVAELETALRAFPHFQSESAPITAEAVSKIAGEYTDMVMTWAPVLHEVEFTSDGGGKFSIIYAEGDPEAGIASGWCVPDSADWAPMSVADCAALAAARAPVEESEIVRCVENLRNLANSTDDVGERVFFRTAANNMARLARERGEARAQLRRLAVVEVHRPAYNGSTVRVGVRCNSCDAQSDDPAPLVHTDRCALKGDA